jgi:EXS family
MPHSNHNTELSIAPWKIGVWDRTSVEPAMLRFPIMTILFIMLWAVNVIIFDRLQLPYHRVLSSKQQSISFLFYSGLFFGTSYALIMSSFSGYFGLSVEVSVLFFYATSVVLVSIPQLPGHEARGSFFKLLYMVIMPGNTISFAEVVLADVFTSLAKVFKDFGTFIVVLYSNITGTSVISHHDNAMILLALLGSLPFWLRVRQCSVQLYGAPDMTARIPITLNTIKYFSAFPPIWLTCAIGLGYNTPTISSLTFLFATINSLYSYTWDILMDW